jgi:TPR repeat protein
MSGRLAFLPSSRILGVAALVVIVAGALLAFVTIDAPPLPQRHAKKARQVETAEQAPAFGRDISLPSIASTPTPSAVEILQAGAPPAADAGQSNGDVATVAMAELRRRANLDDLLAMEEMARRLIAGTGIAKDPDAGAGWMLRAAERGSTQAAFNVAVMYERGFAMPRDSARAVQWYRRAADAGLAMARHNLALLLRDGKGVPRDGAQAVTLLRAAARQGMTASMFILGDVYETGDAAPKDAATAAAWFSITAAFERQANPDKDTPLARTAVQRSQALQRFLTPGELARAQEIAQREYRGIADGLALPRPALPAPAPSSPTPSPAPSPPSASAPPSPSPPPPSPSTPSPSPAVASSTPDPRGWPGASADQVRAIQQMLIDLKLLRAKPSGTVGPQTRAAIRDFQKRNGLPETGEPTKELYGALKTALEASRPK